MNDNKRKRDAAATRERILNAAKRAFADKGFDGAGLREIAAHAGVNVALVNRYFGSKEQLFREGVMAAVNIDALIGGDKKDFGARTAQYFASKNHGEEADPIIAVLRSISSDDIRAMLRAAVDDEIVNKLAQWLGGDNAQTRAALIVSHLLGFDMLHRVLTIQALGVEQEQQTSAHFAAVLQHYVDGGQ